MQVLAGAHKQDKHRASQATRECLHLFAAKFAMDSVEIVTFCVGAGFLARKLLCHPQNNEQLRMLCHPQSCVL